MVDPLSVAANVIGVSFAALHCARLLLEDLQRINDAPETVTRLTEDVRSVDMALTSLQTLKEPEWEALGATVAEQAKTTINTCAKACTDFRADLQRWTRHSSGEGRWALRDRVSVGFFKQGRIKVMSEQLQNCKVTINSVVSIATLYSSIHHTHVTEEIKNTISARQNEVNIAIGTTDEQLAEIRRRMEELNRNGDNQAGTETSESRAVARREIEEEHKALSASRRLLDELLSMAQTAFGNANSPIPVRQSSVQSPAPDRTASQWSSETLGSMLFRPADGEGWTPLHRAVFEANTEAVQELSRVVANTTYRDTNGQTPLHVAAYHGHDKIVQILIANGAEKDPTNHNSHTPLHVAASEGSVSTVRVLLDAGANIEARDREDKTPLYTAARYGKEDAARLLLDRGAQKEAQKADGWVPLHAAAWYGHEAVVRLLIDKGSNKEARNNGGITALYAAAKRGHQKVVKLLLYKGAERNARGSDGWTPLHAAAWFGHLEASRMLLEGNADINARNQDGQTALFAAARNGHGAVVKLLVLSGADRSIETSQGWTAKQVAKANKHQEVVNILRRW